MPAIQPPTPKPATFDDAAIERLEMLLIQQALPAGGLPLEAVHGLFSAAIVGPGETVMPGELLPYVWGQDHEWESVEAAQDALDLLMGLWNDIARRVVNDPETERDVAVPLVALPTDIDESDPDSWNDDHDFPVGAAWAVGFMIAFGLREDEWEARIAQNEQISEDINDIFALLPEPEEDDEHTHADSLDAAATVQLAPDDEPEDPDSVDEALFDAADAEPLTFRERMEIVGELPYILHDLNLQRLHEATPRTPARREETPGRNELCPCGSGKKFKRCHGAPTLH
ncbi:UPF0149 family protein [Chiayiivirga flava]|uniref:YecA family protein n=1 Tax=Chiayiivirga flava TaxID=659595 RepID=A0A7W8D7D1_9GAMM|nr:UPF0149 family protein [Chiayiivirga flava]MBB5209230.1 uncharacterized protein [Chiayiivirga flava]